VKATTGLILSGETEPCINGRISVSARFQKNNDEMAKQLLSEQPKMADCGTAKRPKRRRLLGLHHQLRAEEPASIRTRGAKPRAQPGPASGPRTICSSAAFRSLETAKSSTNAGICRFSFPTFWHYGRFCATRLSEECRKSNTTAASVHAIEFVELKRPPPDGRLGPHAHLLIPAFGPLRMEDLLPAQAAGTLSAGSPVVRWFTTTQSG